MSERTYFASAVAADTGDILFANEFKAPHFGGAMDELDRRIVHKAPGRDYRITSIVEQPTRGPLDIIFPASRSR